MTRPYYKTLDDVPALVRAQYAQHAYKFSPPPVYHSNWDAVAWINHVIFDNLDPETHLWKGRSVL